MSEKNNSSSDSGCLLVATQMVFLALKWVGVISWSWWVVCIPALILLVETALVLFTVGGCAAVLVAVNWAAEK